MNVTNSQLKYAARYKIRQARLRPVVATLFYLVILLAMGFLILELIGYVDYLETVLGEYMELLSAEYSDLGENPENAVTGLLEALFRAMEAVPAWTIPPLGGVLAAAVGLMLLIFQAGHQRFCFLASREENPKFKELTEGFFQFGKVAGILIFRSILISAGLMVFVLPGIVMWYRFRLALLVLWDHPEYTVLRCLGESARISRVGKLLSLDLSFIGWYILNYVLTALLMTPVVELWVRPYLQITLAEYYNRATGWSPKDKAPEPEEETES